MKYLVQRGPHCLLYASAMVFDCSVDQLREEIGFTGNEELWPGLKYPENIRSFHIQEINDCALRRGMAFTLIERMPAMAPAGHNEMAVLMDKEQKLETRFKAALKMPNRGILIAFKPSGMKHALGYDGKEQKIYDSTPLTGGEFTLDKMPEGLEIIQYYMLVS